MPKLKPHLKFQVANGAAGMVWAVCAQATTQKAIEKAERTIYSPINSQIHNNIRRHVMISIDFEFKHL